MEKEELREGLKRLKAHVEQYELESVFLEEGEEAELDSLVIGLEVSEELSLDLTCNFVALPDYGGMLQFYGQLELDGMMKESPETLTEPVILQMVNALNKVISVGQLLYMQDEEEPEHTIGMRYTMLTELDSEDELEKCIDIIELMMDIYELLCSVLILILDGDTVQEAMETVAELVQEM
ncbi:MAG: hypothetical protein HFH50_04940 [Lachnospiraceae bacterium]|jgi:hypothetical protein|nr:hypothetical protein [Lachnospiraceae bacterium]